jgi:hypothetical protein
MVAGRDRLPTWHDRSGRIAALPIFYVECRRRLGFNVETPTLRRGLRASRLRRAIVAALLLLGLAVRWWLACAYAGALYVDNAKVALMALHALRGRFYALFWGQPQLGSLESLVIAPIFAVFGMNDYTLALGLLPWFAVFSIALYAVTRRAAGEQAAWIVLALSAFASPLVQLHQVTALSGYAATLALGTSLVWLTLVIVYDRPEGAWRRMAFTALGLIAGLAFWNSWLIAAYFLVCGLYLILDDPRLPLRFEFVEGVVAFFVGSAPWWVYNLGHGFPSLGLLGEHPSDARLGTLAWVAYRGIPTVIGVRGIHDDYFLGALGAVVAGLVAAVFWFVRRDVVALLRGRVREARPATIFPLLLAASALLYVFARPTIFQIDRYLLPMASALLPMIAVTIARTFDRSPRAGSAVAAAVIAYSAIGVVELHRDFATSPQRGSTRADARLGRVLQKEGIRCGYADRPDAALISYLTRERVVVTDYHELDYPADEFPFHDPALILNDRSADDTLRALNASFSVIRLAGSVIYWPIRYDGVPRRPLARGGWKLTANVAGDDVDLALDGDPSTCWRAPLTPDRLPSLTLDLGRSETVAGLAFMLPKAAPQGFDAIDVESSLDAKHWQLVKKAAFEFPMSFGADGEARVLPDDRQLVLFPPRAARWLRMTRATPRGWSVSEIDAFGVGDQKNPGIILPTIADPSSFELTERRLRRQLEREPLSNEPLRELEALYRSHGDMEDLAAMRRKEPRRFEPQIATGWRSKEFRGSGRTFRRP